MLPHPDKSFRVSKHTSLPQSPALRSISDTLHLPLQTVCLLPFFPAGPLPLTLGFRVLSFTRLYPVSRSEPLASTGRNSLP